MSELVQEPMHASGKATPRRSDVRPNFFVVGAPKCGTTSICHYLGQHADVFIPRVKEPLYFCADEGHYEPWRSKTLDHYLRQFDDGEGCSRVGEGSVWYLYSERAPDRIAEFCPDARIIIALRNPVDMIFSLHGQFLFSGNEDVRDFEKAYALYDQRKAGRAIPVRAHFPKGLCYKDFGFYSSYVERYLTLFGDSVKVVLFDDLVADPVATCKSLFRFLDIDPSFTPDPQVQNSRKALRSIPLQRLLTKGRELWEPQLWMPLEPVHRRLGWRTQRLRSSLLEWNQGGRRNEKMKPYLRRKLQKEFGEDISRLSSIIGRDLSMWTARKG